MNPTRFASIFSRLRGAVRRRGAPATHLPRWIGELGLRTVLDIGANTGQFADEIRGAAPGAQIYSFEPLPDCFEKLQTRFGSDPRFRAFNVALGDAPGDVAMHRSSHSQSSSLLAMGDLHREAFPFSAGESEVRVRVERLDDLAAQLTLEKPLLAKLDVQGFEDRVIAGGRSVLARADLIVTEMTVEPLYRSQSLFDDLYRALRELGFEYRGNLGQLTHPVDGRVLQMDALFVPSPA